MAKKRYTRTPTQKDTRERISNKPMAAIGYVIPL